MKNYITYMHRCIELAKFAKGMTSPNPMVGCVVLAENGEVISEGFHKAYGENHAERDALLKLNNSQFSTLIVNLEPCSHYGKTPPCTDLIIEKGIKTVVYGMQDPNPIVSGKGLEKLKNAGIEVIGPILEDECKKLNEIFIKNQTKNETFVAIKTATTIDGKIATYNGNSKWITSDLARQKGRELRKIYDAILTSSNTIIADNPQMVHNKKVILDRELKTNLNFEIYKQGQIFVFFSENLEKPEDINNVTYIKTPVKNSKLDIDYILKKLYELKIMSVFVEAGGVLNASFLPFADKIYHFVAPKILGDNSGKSCFQGECVEKISDCSKFKLEDVEKFSSDILLTYSKIQ